MQPLNSSVSIPASYAPTSQMAPRQVGDRDRYSAGFTRIPELTWPHDLARCCLNEAKPLNSPLAYPTSGAGKRYSFHERRPPWAGGDTRRYSTPSLAGPANQGAVPRTNTADAKQPDGGPLPSAATETAEGLQRESGIHDGAFGITRCKSHVFNVEILLFVCTRFEVDSSGTKELIFRAHLSRETEL